MPRNRTAEPLSFTTRVTINRLDENIHMNNVEYHHCTESARRRWFAQCHYLEFAKTGSIIPMLDSATMRFRRELKPFQAFTVTCTPIYWTSKRLVFEHRFLGKNGFVHTSGYSCMIFVDKNTWKKTNGNEFYQFLNMPTKKDKDVPESLLSWVKSLEQLSNELKVEAGLKPKAS